MHAGFPLLRHISIFTRSLHDYITSLTFGSWLFVLFILPKSEKATLDESFHSFQFPRHYYILVGKTLSLTALIIPT